ncbi:uncharacterized protein TEOVI_000366700 [Trypanosoma equiperdum]|uniref:Trypanosome variant surface glycoprotein A-type N-terminal domain-containing protein n=1 Tax=Trypanosoma equiperdum TaxID=5694 RepID=A0A1G4III8_TRYEQ|nr:hypothetical protein, conserved [Trypanosoma equiperdum]
MGQSTANIAFVVFVTANLVSVNAELHDNKAQLNNAYDTATYFRQVSQNGNQHLRTALATVAAAVKKTNKLLVLSKRSKDATGAAAQILAAQILHQLQKTTTALETTAGAALEGLAAASRIAGMQEVIAELATTTIQNQNVQTAANVANSALPKIQPQMAVNQHGACLKGKDSRGELTIGQEMATTGQLQWTITALDTAKAGTASGQDLTICSSNSADNTPIERASYGTQTTQIGIKGGKVFTPQRITVTRQTTGSNTDYNELADDTKVPTAKTLNPELKLLRKLKAAAEAIEALSINSDATTLAQAEQLKSVIAKALDGEEGSYSKEETKTKVDAILKELFGAKADNVKTTIEKDLKGLKPPKAAVCGNGDKKLETINDPQELSDAQIYYTVTGYIADQEKKKKSSTSPSCPTKTDKAEEPAKSADECKKHTTERPSKDEKGCDFDEKKLEGERCFSKVETEKKDEKSFSSNLRVSVPQVFF